MLSRTAAHLYWIGRYMERAEFACRLVEATIRLSALGHRAERDQAWRSALSVVGADNAKIDWGKPWEQIDRLIRGCNPAPGAWTLIDGKKLQIFDAQPMPARDPKGIGGKLGEVVAVDSESFTVVCADGRFKVTRVKHADGQKVGAGEFASTANLAVGTRLS